MDRHPLGATPAAGTAIVWVSVWSAGSCRAGRGERRS